MLVAAAATDKQSVRFTKKYFKGALSNLNSEFPTRPAQQQSWLARRCNGSINQKLNSGWSSGLLRQVWQQRERRMSFQWQCNNYEFCNWTRSLCYNIFFGTKLETDITVSLQPQVAAVTMDQFSRLDKQQHQCQQHRSRQAQSSPTQIFTA